MKDSADKVRLPVLPRFSSSTHSTMPVLVLPMTIRTPRLEGIVSSMV